MALVALLLSFCSVFSQNQQPVFAKAERFFSDSLFSPALKEYQNYLGTVQTSKKVYLSRQDSLEQSTAVYKSAVCYFKLNEFAKSADAFDDFVRVFPRDGRVVDARYLASVAQRALGNLKEASERFFQVWRRYPVSGLAQDALFEAAQCAQNASDNIHAIDLFGQFCDTYAGETKSQDAVIALVKLLLAQKDPVASTKRLDDAQKRWPADKSFLSRLAYARALISCLTARQESAGAQFAAMLAYDTPFPEQEEALLNYIAFAQTRKDCKTGLVLYRKLSALYQQKGQTPSREYLLSWAADADACGSFTEEEKILRRTLTTFQQDSANGSVMLLLSQCQEKRHDIAAAFETLQSLASRDSSSESGARAVLSLANLFAGQAEYADALASYRRYCGMKGAREVDRALFEIGRLYQEKFRRYDAAAQEYENVVRRFGESAFYHEALFSLAQCEEQAGGIKAAVQRYSRVVESDAPKELADSARKRMSYLSAFRAQNLENAVRLLADIAQEKADSSDMAVRLMHVAGIYENDLRDFDAALALYDKIPGYQRNPSDSATGKLWLSKARVYEKLFEKARFENDSVRADSARVKALALYRDILRLGRLPAVTDDAAFRIMMLSSPDISAFLGYAAKYARGIHRNEVLLLIGRHYEARGAVPTDTVSRRKAAEAYRTIVRDDPNGESTAQAFLGCGRVYVTLGKPDSALGFLKEFYQHCTDSTLLAEGYFIEACSEKDRQNYSVALEKFKKVLYSYPFSGFARQARFGIAETDFAAGRYHEALANYRLYAQHSVPDERAAWAKLGIGRCCAILGKTGEAVQVLSSLVAEKLPSELSGRARFELAGCARKNNDFALALRQYNLILGLPQYSDRRTVLMKMGSLSFDNRAYADAAATYERAVAISMTRGDSAVAAVGVIAALVMAGSQKAADKKTSQFTARFGANRPEIADVAYYEGLQCLVKKEYDKARARFTEVTEKYETSGLRDDAAYQTALSYFYEGKKDKALEQFNRFVEGYPQSGLVGLAQFKIGMIYHEQNDFEQAVTFFSSALSHPETDSTTRFRAAFNAAVGLQKLSRWLEASRMYGIILDSFPSEISPSSVHLKIGFCLIQASRAAEALAHFQKADDNPGAQEKPEILYWIATCYAKMGDFNRATSEYLKVPALYAGIGRWDMTSECEAARLYERMGEYGKAVSLYKKIVTTDGETGDLGKEALARMEQLNSIMESQ